MMKPVILVIDDDPAILEIFTAFLCMRGYTIHTASGGAEGIALLRSLHPDLIVLDIMMMPMDGWETLCILKSDPDTKSIPVAMFSGKMPDPEELFRFGKYIEDYLIKPLEFRQISDTLTHIIQRSSNWHREQEALKRAMPDRPIVDEYYRLRNQLFLLEKFSCHFNGHYQKIEPVIRDQKEYIRKLEAELSRQGIDGVSGPEPEGTVRP